MGVWLRFRIPRHLSAAPGMMTTQEVRDGQVGSEEPRFEPCRSSRCGSGCVTRWAPTTCWYDNGWFIKRGGLERRTPR